MNSGKRGKIFDNFLEGVYAYKYRRSNAPPRIFTKFWILLQEIVLRHGHHSIASVTMRLQDGDYAYALYEKQFICTVIA